jgi:hypothetical protein
MSKKENDKKKTGKGGFLSLWFSPGDEVVNRLAAELEENRAKLGLDDDKINGESQDNRDRQDNGEAQHKDALSDSLNVETATGDSSNQVVDEANGRLPKNHSLRSGQIESSSDVNKWAAPAVTESRGPVSGSSETEEDTHTHEGFQRYLQRFDFYELLQIDPGASTEQVHKSYLRRVRNLIGSHEIDSRLEPWQVERLVQAISLAHEVLRDQNTRTSYDKNRDFRKYVSEDKEYEPVRRRANSGKSIHSLISLIRYSQLLTPADLDAALAFNQGKTELQIASYLVEVGRLTVEELESITLARYLIALGKITITQYEIIIGEMKETGTPLWVGLVAKGWVKMTDVLSN